MVLGPSSRASPMRNDCPPTRHAFVQVKGFSGGPVPPLSARFPTDERFRNCLVTEPDPATMRQLCFSVGGRGPDISGVSGQTRRFLALGLIAGAFVVLVMFAAIAGIVDFTHQPGEGNHELAASVFLLLVIGSVVFGLATYKSFTGRLFAGQRWGRIDRELVAAGFRHATEREIGHTASIHVQLLSPPVLGIDRGGGVDHVTIGSIGGSEVRAFRARIRGAGRWIDVPAVALRAPAFLAPTLIRPAKRGIRPRIGMERVLFELERFNRSIEVHSVDRFFATAFIDSRVMEWLSQNLRRTVIELADGWAVAWSNALRGFPQSPQELIELLILFNARIPRSIPSLFPQRDLYTRWVHPRKHKAPFSAWLERLTDVSDVPEEPTL